MGCVMHEPVYTAPVAVETCCFSCSVCLAPDADLLPQIMTDASSVPRIIPHTVGWPQYHNILGNTQHSTFFLSSVWY